MSATIRYKTSSRVKIYAKNILTALILGAAVGLLSRGDNKFNALTKPVLSPPAILFPIVWSILYTLMGISYSMLEERRLDDDGTKLIYWIQLIFNLLWPIAFFTLGWRLFSLVWIIILDVLVAAMVMRFYRAYKPAGLLQIPYLLWAITDTSSSCLSSKLPHAFFKRDTACLSLLGALYPNIVNI